MRLIVDIIVKFIQLLFRCFSNLKADMQKITLKGVFYAFERNFYLPCVFSVFRFKSAHFEKCDFINNGNAELVCLG